MSRKHRVLAENSGFKVLLVDDDPDYLDATQRILEREGHRVLRATRGEEALNLIRSERPEVVLLDYFLGSDSAESLVFQVRQFDRNVQVILQTGYTGEEPPLELLKRLDISGYHDKSDGPEKLIVWTEAGLKAARALRRLEHTRRAQGFILEATSELHKPRPMRDLLSAVLKITSDFVVGLAANFDPLLSGSNGDSARPRTFIALTEDENDLVVRDVSDGPGRGQPLSRVLSPEGSELARRALRLKRAFGEPLTVLPLYVGEFAQGAILCEKTSAEEDAGLLQMLANATSVAIRNAELYEMAALDPLTGVLARRFFELWFLREVKAAFRARQPISLLMIDMDGMKRINDSAGHLVGDQALALVGRILREVTRDNDIVARFGGDEFCVVLPRESQRGATEVAQRISDRLRTARVSGIEGSEQTGELTLGSSLGIAVLEPESLGVGAVSGEKGRTRFPRDNAYFQERCTAMVDAADAALYSVKRRGGGTFEFGATVSWPTFDAGSDRPRS